MSGSTLDPKQLEFALADTEKTAEADNDRNGAAFAQAHLTIQLP